MLDICILGTRGERYTRIAKYLREKNGDKVTIFPTKPGLLPLFGSSHAIYHTALFVSPAAMLWLNKKLRGKKYTLTLQGLVWNEAEDYAKGKFFYGLRVWFYKFFAKQALENAETVVTVSDWVAHELKKFSPRAAKKTVTIYHAIDAQRFANAHPAVIDGVGKRDDVLLFVTHFNYAKKARAAKIVIDSMEHVLKKRGNAKLVVVCDKKGAYYPEVEKFAGLKPYADSVIFTDKREDIPEVLAGADVFVYASYLDGMPRAPLEAMAAGLPVVAVDACSLSEEVTNNHNGFLVPADARKFAEAALKLLLDKKLAGRMGAVGKRFVRKEFSFEKMSKSYGQVWNRILE